MLNPNTHNRLPEEKSIDYNESVNPNIHNRLEVGER